MYCYSSVGVGTIDVDCGYGVKLWKLAINNVTREHDKIHSLKQGSLCAELPVSESESEACWNKSLIPACFTFTCCYNRSYN